MTEKQKKKLTLKKFAEYEKEICKRMGFSKDVWRMYRDDIMKYGELYDPNVTYAGRGSSENFDITEKLVPELFDNFIYFTHDRFYTLIDLARYNVYYLRSYKLFKPKADKIMKEMMEIKAKRPTILPEIYHFFVKWFG
ncbi:MAG: hypothetical protein GY928_37420 [Colwellia sp.]|nr:hypothetical protein [Colwellia sp.]